MRKSMIKQVINGTDILALFKMGAQEVYANKKYLNSINVFPIADGDTGTNLATTMKAMVEKAHIEVNFSRMLHGMSVSGLENARGNSGILFASYIKGLALEGKIYEFINIKQFSNIAHCAVAHLYQAIENPVEGTIISVIRDWATFLFTNNEKYENFQDLLLKAYQTANESLQHTTTQLEILKVNQVVDSGAAGFVKFLNGMNHYFDGGEVEESTPWKTDTMKEIDIYDTNRYRFCTEVFLERPNTSSAFSDFDLNNKIKSELSPYGDSLIVSSQERKVRVHIHTDSPEIIVEILKEYGSLLEQKVDDMKLQKSVNLKRLSTIGILTDSIADIPEEFKLSNQIHTLPLGILLNDSVYLDKLTIKLKQLFIAIDNSATYPTSSQPEPGRVKVFLENLLEIYDSLIFITVSSKLSGTYQTISQELKKIDLKGKKVTVIDSHLNSGAQGLLVKAAADFRNKGYLYEDIVKEIKAMIPKTSIYVCLNTLEYAVRSGRVPNTIGKIGKIFGLRPIMTLDKNGNGATFGIGFSQKNITRKIFKLVKNILKRKGIKSYSIVHADNTALAFAYKKELTKIIGKEPEFIAEISSIIAIHSGLGCVAVSIIEE